MLGARLSTSIAVGMTALALFVATAGPVAAVGTPAPGADFANAAQQGRGLPVVKLRVGREPRQRGESDIRLGPSS